MNIIEESMPEEGTRQHYEVLIELGQCYTNVGEIHQAKECFEKAASIEPDEAGPYVGLGVIALQEDSIEDASVSFRVALRLDPKSARAYSGLAMVAQKQEDLNLSFDYYLKSLELDSDNLTALLGLFQISCRMGSFSKVIHYLEVYLDMHPGDTSVLFTLGTLYMKDKQLENARQALQKVAILDPENGDAAGLLEEVEHQLKQQSQVGVF